ncbi:probable cytochrome P450 9f2 [Bradysia coprophila]|uniref:probable cytochrome P450 9f2 n=1 Tax=Bradysia coprophila TaxID=38358 RepID=UPI00187D78CB|nr:probable cytochrome P450 9f2 [Bradysia coprophila]
MLLLLYAIIVTLFLLYERLKHKDDYFVRKGIPFLKPAFLFGSRHDLLLRNRPLTETIRNWYNEYPDAKMIGLFEFSTPTFVVRDPKLLKKLTVKEFDSFADHKSFIGEDVDPLFGRALFSLQGQKWRDMRATLSPAFTGSKMRQMFEFVSSVGQQVATTLKTQIENGGESCFEFKDLARKFTVDTIATCAFGIEVNSFAHPTNDFHRIAGKVANFSSFLTTLKFVGYFAAPKLMRALKIKFFDEETTEFFQKAINETMRIRERDGIIRHDMINLLIQAKQGKLTHEKELETKKTVEGFATVEESQVGKNAVTRKWEDDDLYAQCFIFFFAGFDTVSTVMTFMAYELMVNTDAQRKLQDEIDEMNGALDGKKVNYEQIQGMKYMDQVVCETLRLWPPAPAVDRLCVKDYEIQYDDTKFMMEKGKNFYIPIYGIHHDERYFENAEKFDPERFSEENRRNIDPDTYIPFGLGPRNCIGSRFALMELKTIIYYLLLNFDFVPTEKTQIPLKLSNNPTQLQAEKGVWVGFKPRK